VGGPDGGSSFVVVVVVVMALPFVAVVVVVGVDVGVGVCGVTLGFDGAGVVDETGDDAEGVAVGGSGNADLASVASFSESIVVRNLLEIMDGSPATAAAAAALFPGGVYFKPTAAAAAYPNTGGCEGACETELRITPAYLSSSSIPESSTACPRSSAKWGFKETLPSISRAIESASFNLRSNSGCDRSSLVV